MYAVFFVEYFSLPKSHRDDVSVIKSSTLLYFYFHTKLNGVDIGNVIETVSGSGFPHTPPRQLQFKSIVLLVQATETKLTFHVPENFVGRKA